MEAIWRPETDIQHFWLTWAHVLDNAVAHGSDQLVELVEHAFLPLVISIVVVGDELFQASPEKVTMMEEIDYVICNFTFSEGERELTIDWKTILDFLNLDLLVTAPQEPHVH